MRLTSPSLPIGAYSYSQGLEFAIASGWVYDQSSAMEWIQGLLEYSLMYVDLPILERLHCAWQNNQRDKVAYWNDFLLASRDSCELREEDLQLGKALARLLTDLELHGVGKFQQEPLSFLTVYSFGAVRWEITINDAAHGLLWMWGENLVLGAMKLVPLGQTAGQKILSRFIDIIPAVVARGLALDDEEIGFTAPGQGIASALHETQYVRLFRS